MGATVVCLAGGPGRRLGSINGPKPLVDINGRPLLDYSVSEFKDAGIARLIIHIGPWGNAFGDFLRKANEALRCEIVVKQYPDDSQTLLGALQQCLEHVTTPFVYWDGDVIVPPGTLSRFMANSNNHIAAVACSPSLLASTHLQLSIDSPRAIATSNEETGTLCGIGAYLFREELRMRIQSSENESDIDDVVRCWMRDGGDLGIFDIGPVWEVIHTQDDLRRARDAEWIKCIPPTQLIADYNLGRR